MGRGHRGASALLVKTEATGRARVATVADTSPPRGLQRFARCHQHSEHPGHLFTGGSDFPGVADYGDLCLSTCGVPAEVGRRLLCRGS